MKTMKTMKYMHPLSGVSILKEPVDPYYINDPSNILPFCNDILSLEQEAFFVIAVRGSGCRIISRCLITYGILDATLVHAREVFRYAVSSAAKAILLLHNHPSGDTTPSNDDIVITRKLVEAGKVLDISVLDHIIIGEDGYDSSIYSFKKSGIVSFGNW